MPSGKLIVGLTGGIGSGKSAAADIFNQLGVTIIDADLASRKVVAEGQPALQKLAEHFGKDILTASGSGLALDRRKLRSIIFEQPKEREWLNNLLHPLIRKYMDDEVTKSTSSYVIKVIPLLVEAGLKNQVDRILVIDVPEATQQKRVLARDSSSQQEINNIIQSQASREDRLKAADDVIINDSSLDDLEKAVKTMHNTYLKLATKSQVN